MFQKNCLFFHRPSAFLSCALLLLLVLKTCLSDIRSSKWWSEYPHGSFPRYATTVRIVTCYVRSSSWSTSRTARLSRSSIPSAVENSNGEHCLARASCPSGWCIFFCRPSPSACINITVCCNSAFFSRGCAIEKTARTETLHIHPTFVLQVLQQAYLETHWESYKDHIFTPPTSEFLRLPGLAISQPKKKKTLQRRVFSSQAELYS